MNAKEKVRSALVGKSLDIPLFCPAVYEHKARLLEKSVSEVSRDKDLLAQAVLSEYETYRPDMLTVGIDVYNVETEALGGVVDFPAEPEAVPDIKVPLLDNLEDINELKPIEPEKAARMPLMLEAAQEVEEKIGKEVFIRGAVSGPYSIAAKLLGIEKLILAALQQPQEITRFLDFCTEAALCYGCAFLNKGINVCIFDSLAGPPLMSPQLYNKLVLPRVKRLISSLKRAGAEFVEYVVGGDTSKITAYMVESGADIILADYNCPINPCLQMIQGHRNLLRRNINPHLIEQGPDEQLEKEVNTIIKLALESGQIIIGTGIISYNTAIERVQMFKNMCLNKWH